MILAKQARRWYGKHTSLVQRFLGASYMSQ